MTNFAQTERAALCDLFDEVGPDAPTLCEGWTTYDLAAHLVVREHRPDGAAGIVVKPLAGWGEKVRTGLRDGNAYTALVDQVRHGPPLWWPTRFVPGLDVATNTVEFFVHHEDVRRAQPGWEPRPVDKELEAALWRRLVPAARGLMRRAPVGVTLVSALGGSVVASGDGRAVRLHGPPSELTLVAFGRAPQVRVEPEGEPADVAAVLTASYGI